MATGPDCEPFDHGHSQLLYNIKVDKSWCTKVPFPLWRIITMAPNKFIYFNLTLLLSVYSISCYKLQFLGNFTANRPGFLSLIQTKDSGNTSDEYSLYISSFNGIPFTTDHVYYIPSIGRILQGLDRQILNRLTVKSLTSNIVWPNEVNQVPSKYIILSMQCRI